MSLTEPTDKVGHENMADMVSIHSIRKRFPGVEVLKGITFSLKKGRIYGLVGENGAGKSTLVKILMGIHQPDGGEIFVGGEKARIREPSQARYTYKMDTVFQEHALIPQLSVAENIFLDKLNTFYTRGLIDQKRLQNEAKKALREVGLDIDVTLVAGEFAEDEKSLIELAKALSRQPQILILDEMTAPLESSVVNDVFDVMRKLKERGKTLVFISHRLEEVFKICDEIIVLRDGNLEGVVPNAFQEDPIPLRKTVIGMMTGTERGLSFPEKTGLKAKGEAVLSLRNLKSKWLKNINLEVGQGEIVALAGLRGQGQSRLLRTVAGLLPEDDGEIRILGEPVKIRNPRDAIASGIFYISDKRDQEELWLTHDVWLNISVASITDRTRLGFIGRREDRKAVERMVSRLRIETPSLAQIVRNLSGGNRQKVVLGKYLLARPKILLVDQPTMGLDVGAKTEIYYLLRKLSDEGIPTLAVLTDLEEVVSLPDRLLVMREGEIVREFSQEIMDEVELLDSYYG
jgi:ABC-type sugar transport system ATPase subunit